MAPPENVWEFNVLLETSAIKLWGNKLSAYSCIVSLKPAMHVFIILFFYQKHHNASVKTRSFPLVNLVARVPALRHSHHV